jgi:hypothetical protein
MGTITTKYSIGDRVFHSQILTEKRRRPCPDCLGAKKWEATSPAGTKYLFDCPRCSASYHSDSDLQLDYSAYTPAVRPLTIGSIQFNSAKGWDHGARYMCRETGVGSGSVYNEDDLFQTEEEATAAAQIKADIANKETEWIVKLYDKTLKLSDYQLSNATMEQAKGEKSRASSMLWNIGDLFNTIEEAEDKDAILEAINDYKNYDWARDKEKVGVSPSPQATEQPHD